MCNRMIYQKLSINISVHHEKNVKIIKYSTARLCAVRFTLHFLLCNKNTLYK
jgi:hypothetical protein